MESTSQKPENTEPLIQPLEDGNTEVSTPEKVTPPAMDVVNTLKFETIITKDNIVMTKPYDIVSQCVFIKEAIDEREDNEKLNEAKDTPSKPSSEDLIKTTLSKVVDIKDVTSGYFEKICEFIKHYSDSPYDDLPKPLHTSDITELLSDKFYIDFCRQSFPIIHAYFDHSMYLDYKPLTKLMGATIASQMYGKSIEKIREMFGAINDFSPEEYQEIQQEVKLVQSVPTID